MDNANNNDLAVVFSILTILLLAISVLTPEVHYASYNLGYAGKTVDPDDNGEIHFSEADIMPLIFMGEETMEIYIKGNHMIQISLFYQSGDEWGPYWNGITRRVSVSCTEISGFNVRVDVFMVSDSEIHVIRDTRHTPNSSYYWCPN